MSLILVTNDDGIYAPGLAVLAEALSKIGRVVVIAPDRDNSAASHSLTMRRPLRVTEKGTDHYAVNGTPTDCITIGVGKILTDKPDLVVSGINPGQNLGDDVRYSGTVSAAFEGTMLGISSLAISLAGEEPYLYETAAYYAVTLSGDILKRGLPLDTLLNVNVPNKPRAAVPGMRFTGQGRRIYDGAIKETSDPWGKKHYWIGGGTPVWQEGSNTDDQAIMADEVSITPLHLDLTNHAALKTLQQNWIL